MDDLPRYKMFIGGEWSEAQDGAVFATLNPYTQENWAYAPDAGTDDLDRAVAAAQAAMDGEWGLMTGAQRSQLLRRLADILERDAQALAEVETRDNGKLLREMGGQMAYLPEWYRYFAGVADKLAGDLIASDRPNFMIYSRHEPIGVVAGIAPWNSPLLLMTWKLAPALAAGCSFVAKPSDYTPISLLEFAKRVEEAGFPPGTFNAITSQGAAISQALVSHPGVSKVAFTGSTAVGIEVGKAAISNLTRVSLELGGKSANIVFADADLDAALNGVVAGIFAATGQTCIAGSRLLVERAIHDEFVERLSERARDIVLGDPMDAASEMGPLANAAQLRTVEGFVRDAIGDGARVAHGGQIPDGLGGLFFEPTILTDVGRSTRIAQEEVFGPVLAVLPFDDEADAVLIANDSRYGLGAGVWTKDIQRAHRVAAAVKAGSVWINSYRVVAPGVPFGGYKHSGWGRENGADAVYEYTETKAVWVELSGATRDPFRLG